MTPLGTALSYSYVALPNFRVIIACLLLVYAIICYIKLWRGK